MKWVRIAANIGADPSLGAIADALGVRRAHAVGLCTLVFAQMPEHARNGDLSNVPDSTLEDWAGWHGKRGAFASLFRRELCSSEGVLRSWEKHNGRAIREADAALTRMRDRRAQTPAKEWERIRAQVLAEYPICQDCGDAPSKHVDHITPLRQGGTNDRANLQAICASCHGRKTAEQDGGFGSRSPSVRRTFASNGTGRDVTGGTTSGAVDLREGERRPHPDVENSGPLRPAPPAGAGSDNGEPPPRADVLLSPTVQNFLEQFYAGAGEDRRVDVLKQLRDAMTALGAVLDRGTRVRAADLAHLETCCGAVMAARPARPDVAIRFVLLKLRDTYTETLSARDKATEPRRVRPPDGGAPERIGDMVAKAAVA